MQPTVIDVSSMVNPDLEPARLEQTASKIKKIEEETSQSDQDKIVELYESGHHVRTISNMLEVENPSTKGMVSTCPPRARTKSPPTMLSIL